MVEMIFGKNRF